jgi:hypothetical protein
MKIESRDQLRSLVALGDGSMIVVPVERERYGQTGWLIHINQWGVL